MKLKTMVAATLLSISSLASHAITLDAISGSVQWKLAGQTTESNVWSGTTEFTWGVGAITSLSSAAGIWNAGSSDGTYLYYMMYGINEGTYVSTSTGFDVYNKGATGGVADSLIHIDIYRTTTQIPSLDQYFNADPSGRTGYNSYNLLTGLGATYLEIVMAPGKSSVYPDATLVQSITSANLPTDGIGSFFGDVAGGTSAAKWDTNGFVGHDFDGKFTLSINGDTYGTGTCTDAQIKDNTCFAGYINDPIRSRAIPEPGSLALIGLGLAGLAGLRQRRKQQA